jgi:hypothetical protein
MDKLILRGKKKSHINISTIDAVIVKKKKRWAVE